jgi:hypothetical protein
MALATAQTSASVAVARVNSSGGTAWARCASQVPMLLPSRTPACAGARVRRVTSAMVPRVAPRTRRRPRSSDGPGRMGSVIASKQRTRSEGA